MHSDLSELIKQNISENLLEKIAALLGENTVKVQNGLQKASHILIDLLHEKFSNDKSEDIDKVFGDGSKLDKLQNNLAGGNQTVNYLNIGLDKSRELIGDKSESVFAEIANDSGLRTESIPFLMGVVHPFILGLMGKQKSSGLDRNALLSLMSSAAIDAPTRSEQTAAAIAKAERIIVPKGEADLKIESGQQIKPLKKSRKGLYTFFALLLLAVVAFLFRNTITQFFNGVIGGLDSKSIDTSQNNISIPDGNQITSSDTSGASQQDTVVPDKPAATIESLSKKIGSNYRFMLPGGASIDVPEGSFESDVLIALANNSNTVFNKPYVLERVNFDSGSSALTDDSRLQITGLAAILNAYPDLKVHLRGHTDNRGSADSNLAISTKRAQAVKSALMHLAVEQNRISIQGMGPIEPIANNNSEDGRARNRRIDLSIIN